MLHSIDKKIRLFLYFLIFILLSTQISIKDNIKKKINYGITDIKVFGLSNNNNLKVSKSLNSILFKNILFLKRNDLKKILNKNNLIEDFNIKKFYPNELRIYIKKTNFLAITNNNNNKFYIGSNGKLINIKNNQNYNKTLPFVFSQNNYKDFIVLKKIIDKSKFTFSEIDSFYHFPSKRWDIKTLDGLLIKLPETNILKSLELAYSIKTKKKFKANKIIDLRVPNNIILYNE